MEIQLTKIRSLIYRGKAAHEIFSAILGDELHNGKRAVDKN
jgi:hypothetical protein